MNGLEQRPSHGAEAESLMRLLGRVSGFVLGVFITVAVAPLTPVIPAGPADGVRPVRSWLAERACRMSADRSPVDTPNTGCPGLDGLAARAREAIRGVAEPEEVIGRLNQFFFEEEGFQPNHDLDTADHLLLGRVLLGRKGHCVGLATVYLVLAEEMGLPIHAVATPRHVFLRWDDGKFRRNIELFQKGRDVPDADYIREQRIPKESLERGVFLASLTRKEFLGFIYQNRGVLESRREDYEASGADYRRALRLNPKLEAAHYNLGNDALKQKRYRKAIRDYTRAFSLYPADVWALHNRGLAWKGLGETEKAERDWRLAREIDPGVNVPE